ncbi:monosaccharide ABC transporter substrate-binding protein (CUT2 family) [Hydrogenispora ethanolica]|jgi:ABC-type sugar transport system substrate-binding protein|uniref:Monosaccharide ABC transporter substrate-binding protein (CUT2 family) n=1 Tax=Hydrogenispora ethanolica TaxID=1082276 RepID=A0A4R1R1N6_HYDET|nr:substrate-binding domain-containing protein [Hydrogenispora ethanolica]TCL59244.1 monosaccharide ABC transporter substrate-binding protein (CUT2 family) [Hydrogenispora ethanolica]
MKKAIAIHTALLTIFLVTIVSGNISSAERKFKIGITHYGLKNEYTILLSKAQRETAAKFNVDLDIFDGNYDVKTQYDNFDYMIAQRYDAIIFTPVDVDAMADAVEKAVRNGIPVIGVNTQVNSDKLTSYIGSNDISAGEMEMTYLAKKMGGRGNIVIIEGPIGSSAQVQRRRGIHNVLARYPKIKVLSEKTANWSRSEGFTLMENWLKAFPDKIQGVCGHNDEMALGAIKALERRGLKVPVVGVDGIYDGLQAIKERRLTATCFQDAQGQGSMSVEVAVKFLKGEKVAKNYWIPFELVTAENVAQYFARRK